MRSVFRNSRLTAVVALTVLSGCSVSGLQSVKVEDRSLEADNKITRSVGGQQSTAEVTALKIRPKFKASNSSGANLNTQASTQTKAPEVTASVQNQATIALLNTAKYQTTSGKLRAAQSSLERALRISPKDPEVYQSLGEVHRQLGEFAQAEQFVLKGIAVAAGQSSKLRRLWSALAKIRSQAGDTVGANQAFQKSQSY
ncbi:MAG: tetratricopeptide repeat protein [Pseudomonadales bacterium]|nr:tetratricopeptide repeat protein [Pseudomonadales bacterium]